jgi:hypothetical protein
MVLFQGVIYLVGLGLLIAVLSWIGADANRAIFILASVTATILALSLWQALSLIRTQRLALVRRCSLVLGGVTIGAAVLIGINGVSQRQPGTLPVVTLGTIMALSAFLVPFSMWLVNRPLAR